VKPNRKRPIPAYSSLKRFCFKSSGGTVEFGFTTRRFRAKTPAVIFGPRKIRRVLPQQVHSSRVVRITGRHLKGLNPGAGIVVKRCDGLVTDHEDTALFIRTADCLPIFLFAPETSGAVGILHAGWRGLARGILRTGLRRFLAVSKAPARKVIAVFGPAVGPCCYEVGRELTPLFHRKAFRPGLGRVFLDLAAVARRRLRQEGMLNTHITDLGLCTSCRNGVFYSFRREGAKAGRQFSWIVRYNM